MTETVDDSLPESKVTDEVKSTSYTGKQQIGLRGSHEGEPIEHSRRLSATFSQQSSRADAEYAIAVEGVREFAGSVLFVRLMGWH